MIGKEILNYTIVSQIGSGGMGSVYLAEHKFIKQQRVAIKVIKSDMFNESSKARLRQEAEHLAGLNHPNIVKFLNYEIDPSGNVFLIMEYAEGMTLDQYINRKTGLIVESKILPLFEPILDAFDYAHRKKIVHRDIKPANIIITADGTPKILDFGISTIMDDSAEGKKESFIIGTPSYMSPEQVRGCDIDTRSDIYSLGVMLHQMLSGNAPYDTTTMSEIDIQTKVIGEPLPRLKSYYRYISDKTQAVVDKATAKDKKNRYQNCAEFKKALHNAIVKDPVPKSTIAIVAAVIVLLVGAGGFFVDYNLSKVRYYKDYVEQWGVPQGIGRISASQKSHMRRMYKFEYKHHKLQRVSHVNSLGNVIDDVESERLDRPVDQRFFYSDSRKVSLVKVYNRGGRCLYVKSYNDKLNAVVFQYDDEFGQEKSYDSNSAASIRENDSPAGRHSRVSRWLLEYDDNGYVSKIEYAAYQNVKVGDSYGIYARTYVRDDKGRVLEERYLGFDGSPKATSWGLGMKKFEYDADDNWVRSEYYTVDGKPALDSENGLYVYRQVYDKYGNVTGWYHEDYSGNPMLPKKYGIAGSRLTINDSGFVVSQEVLDIDGKAGYAGGYSRADFEYDANGYVSKTQYYDAEGNPSECTQGFASKSAVNDANGNTLEEWCFGIDGEKVETSNGYAGIIAKYDSLGQMTENMCYGADGAPVALQDGTTGTRIEYNALGLRTKEINLDAEGNPTYDNDGIAILYVDYDDRGNMVKVSNYDIQDQGLTLMTSGIAGWESTFDDFGNEVSRNYFDASGAPCLHSDGYSGYSSEYDDSGNNTSIRYYNLKHDLVLVGGVAGYDYCYDEKGNMLVSVPIGTDDKPSRTKLTVEYKYDANDNVIECANFDENHKPALCGEDYHKYTCVYNNRNQRTEIRYYGTSGHLVKIDGDNYAIRCDEYDDRGDNVRVSFFGTDEKPVTVNNGWSSATQEFDSMGRSVRQLFFNTEGNPTDPKKMVPEVILKYDKWGNVIYNAAADGNGNLIVNPNSGWSIGRNEFDSKGNILNASYYDEQDRAVKCKDGYHKEVYEYNDNHNLVAIRLFDTEGNPVNCKAGYHRVEISYGETGNVAKTRKYYSASGASVSSESWNGSEWVPDRSSALREGMSNLNSSCPLSLGSEYGDMTLVSCRVISGSAVEIVLSVGYSKYELSYEKQSAYKNYARQFANLIREALSDIVSMNGVSIITIVKDSKGRELHKFTA